VSGEDDDRRDPSDGPLLEEQFRSAGAAAALKVLPIGHGLTTEDEDVVRAWLRDLRNQPGNTAQLP